MRVAFSAGCFEELYYGFDKNSKASAAYDVRARELAISMVHESGMSDVKDLYFTLFINYDVLELSTFLKDKEGVISSRTSIKICIRKLNLKFEKLCAKVDTKLWSS